MYIIISILLLLVITLSYVCINLYTKNEALYSTLEKNIDVEEHSIVLIKNLVVTYTQVLAKIKRIDRRGSFESDDEIGFVFTTIKKTIESLVEELKSLEKELNETDGNSDKK